MLVIHVLDKSQEVASVLQPIDTTFFWSSTTGDVGGGSAPSPPCAKLLPKFNVPKNHTNSNAIFIIAKIHSVPNKYFFPCFWKWFCILFVYLNK
jgi:hypothetical protein